jgi:hypothetical protein
MASQKITELTAATTAARDTLLPFVEDPGGTPLTKKITKEDMGIPRSVHLTSDVGPRAVTTMADVTNLLLPVVNGYYYWFKFIVLVRSAATTTGLKLSVTIPTVTVFSAIADTPTSAADGTDSIFQGRITSSDDAVIGTGVPSNSEDHMASIEGIIVPSADGNIQVRYASEVDTSNVTIKAGSSGLLWKLT